MSKSTRLTNKFYVLKPEGEDVYAKASRTAMLTYAKVIYDENPQLAQDLVAWVATEELAANMGIVEKWKGTVDEPDSS